MFDHAQVQTHAFRDQLFQQFEIPTLVGIHHQLGVRPCRANRSQLLKRLPAIQLDFQDRRINCRGRLGRHRLRGRFQADRENGGDGLGIDAGQLPDGFAGFLAFQVPQGAVDGVAGPAGRQQLLQTIPCNTLADFASDSIDLLKYALRGFIPVKHALGFAAAGKSIFGQLDYQGG